MPITGTNSPACRAIYSAYAGPTLAEARGQIGVSRRYGADAFRGWPAAVRLCVLALLVIGSNDAVTSILLKLARGTSRDLSLDDIAKEPLTGICARAAGARRLYRARNCCCDLWSKESKTRAASSAVMFCKNLVTFIAKRSFCDSAAVGTCGPNGSGLH